MRIRIWPLMLDFKICALSGVENRIFMYFCRFLVLLNADPDPEEQFQCESVRILNTALSLDGLFCLVLFFLFRFSWLLN
jgi:hypothetical protein